MGRPSLPADVRACVVGRIQAGQSARHVAKTFGISDRTARNWYRRETGKRVGKHTPGVPPKYPRSEWAALYRKGLTTGQIATKSGVKLMAVVHSLRKISPTGRVGDLRGDANA